MRHKKTTQRSKRGTLCEKCKNYKIIYFKTLSCFDSILIPKTILTHTESKWLLFMTHETSLPSRC